MKNVLKLNCKGKNETERPQFHQYTKSDLNRCKPITVIYFSAADAFHCCTLYLCEQSLPGRVFYPSHSVFVSAGLQAGSGAGLKKH